MQHSSHMPIRRARRLTSDGEFVTRSDGRSPAREARSRGARAGLLSSLPGRARKVQNPPSEPSRHRFFMSVRLLIASLPLPQAARVRWSSSQRAGGGARGGVVRCIDERGEHRPARAHSHRVRVLPPRSPTRNVLRARAGCERLLLERDERAPHRHAATAPNAAPAAPAPRAHQPRRRQLHPADRPRRWHRCLPSHRRHLQPPLRRSIDPGHRLAGARAAAPGAR